MGRCRSSNSKMKTLTQPLARMVEPGLTLGMADYVMGHVFTISLKLLTSFKMHCPASGMAIKFLHYQKIDQLEYWGLVNLECIAQSKLSEFGFKVSGWSRSKKTTSKHTMHEWN